MSGKYQVITDKLELELKKMRSEGKTKLPPEQELAGRFSCSRQTVRASLDILRDKGLIVKKKGSGSYLADERKCGKTVFFMTEDCDRYESHALISGLRDRLGRFGYKLKCFSSGGSVSGAKDILLQVMEDLPSALIIEPSSDLIPDPNLKLVEKINELGIPAVYCNSSLGSVHVAPDSFEGGRILTRYLNGAGRKRIACIFRMDDSSGLDCFRGYMEALPDSAFDESGCFLITRKEETDIISGRDKKLEDMADKIRSGFDAVICGNGMIAHRLVQIFGKNARSASGDTAVACFDNCGAFADDDGIITSGYDNDLLCRSLASAAVSLAEGRSAKSVTVPAKQI